MPSHRVADADVVVSNEGVEATVSYYVLNADRATYIPARYSIPTDPDTGGNWLPTEWQSANILVKEVSETPLSSGNSYLVTIIANNHIDNASGSSADDMLNDVKWEYPQKQILFDPQWYGIRKALGKEDSSKFFATFKSEDASADPNLSEGTYGMYHHYLKYNSTEASITLQTGPATPANLAQQGDLIFINAKPAIWFHQTKDANGVPIQNGVSPAEGYEDDSLSTNTRGSADYTKSPFLASPVPDINWVGQKIRMLTGVIRFFVQARQTEIAVFQGVNGNGSDTVTGFPRRCYPFDASSRKWRAVGQTIVEVRDKTGADWLQVTRTMEYAPGSLKWDADKNGGYWSW